MSLSALVYAVCDKLAIPRPTSIVGNADDSARLLLALANEEGQELASRHSWQVLTKEFGFSATATITQTTIQALTGTDFSRIVNDTIWNRSSLRPLRGSVNPQRWQRLRASNVTGPYPEFRIRGNYLLMLPAPSSGDGYYGEYISKNWCQNAAGTTTASAWADDTDTGVLDEKIMELGVRWRWKQVKGLDYSEEFRVYGDRVNDAIARDGGKTVLNMGKSRRGYPFGPDGSWDIT